MPTTKPSKKNSTEIKTKQKRKDAEDVADKEVISLKPNKRARKDNPQPETQSNSKPSSKSTTKPPKNSLRVDKSEKKNSEALAEPSKQVKKTSKVAASPKKNVEKQEESNSSDEESVVEDDENDEDESGEDDENYHLTGFSSGEDSSDEEVDQNAEALDVSKLPSLAKEDVALKKRLDEAKSRKHQVGLSIFGLLLSRPLTVFAVRRARCYLLGAYPAWILRR